MYDDRLINIAFTRYPSEGACVYCGTHWGNDKDQYGRRACAAATCLACGSKQCMGNGAGNGQCSVCYIGLLPGWSGSTAQCQRARCTEQAVKIVRKRKVCATHGGPTPVELSSHYSRWERADLYVERQVEANRVASAARARRQALRESGISEEAIARMEFAR
jgi:hypothetical protein